VRSWLGCYVAIAVYQIFFHIYAQWRPVPVYMSNMRQHSKSLPMLFSLYMALFAAMKIILHDLQYDNHFDQ
jgi:hypothetical protein